MHRTLSPTAGVLTAQCLLEEAVSSEGKLLCPLLLRYLLLKATSFIERKEYQMESRYMQQGSEAWCLGP
jgi:hypothetical protein